ncbi:MAG TPA: SsrA-binding protein SmpB [Longimicrobiales bacterium]
MSKKTLARNRKALHEYHVVDRYEAGIVLAGPEVKSIRAGKVSLAEAFARIDGNEVFVHGMHISPYDPASRWNLDATRTRKLLLNRREIRRLIGATQQEGFTLVPLELYLKDGYIKVELALARGKKRFDKREDVRKRDAAREIQRAVKGG